MKSPIWDTQAGSTRWRNKKRSEIHPEVLLLLGFWLCVVVYSCHRGWCNCYSLFASYEYIPNSIKVKICPLESRPPRKERYSLSKSNVTHFSPLGTRMIFCLTFYVLYPLRPAFASCVDSELKANSFSGNHPKVQAEIIGSQHFRVHIMCFFIVFSHYAFLKNATF